MSYRLETLNRGQVEDFGCIFGDIECVRLGTLPAMPIGQFAQYATETILEVLESGEVDSKNKQVLLVEVAYNCGRVAQASTQELNRVLMGDDNSDDKLARKIAQTFPSEFAGAVGNPSREYSKNPFVFQNGQINISNVYDVTAEEFVIFAARVIGGGLSGWNPRVVTIPEEIKSSAAKLMITISEYNNP